VVTLGPLTRYFLDDLFGRQLLDEDGLMAMRRVFISAAAGVASLALYLPRMLHKKFADLDALPVPEPYRQALLANGFLIICLVFVLAALVAAIAAPAMFPTEIDYVTLTPLPLSRRRIFGARALALAIFAGAFLLVGQLFSVSFPLFTQGRWAEHGQIERILAFTAGTIGVSLFAFLAVMAVQGVILALLPRRWTTRASMFVQSAAIAGLILAAPFVFQPVGEQAWLTSRPAALAYFPPAWFLGIEQTLLGRSDPFYASLALGGLVALGGVGAVAIGCYAWIYRRPERLASLPPRGRSERPPWFSRSSARRGGAWTAVWTFATATLARNRLPQLVFLVAWAVGLAVVANDLLDGVRQMAHLRFDASEAIERAAISMPLVLALMGVAGLRAAFLLPVSLQANWVFRMTDWSTARADRLDAVEQAFVRLAIVPALLLSAPVQIGVLGVGRGLTALFLATLACAVLLELVLAGWRRVPFTCTWLPGKRPLPFALLAVIGVFWGTASVSVLVAWSIREPPQSAVVLSVVLLVLAAGLRWRRRRSWAAASLEFEDQPIDSFQTLGLGPS
jgi:hypothetical protein